MTAAPAPSLWITLLPVFVTIGIFLLSAIIGFVYAWGRLKASVMTKKECNDRQHDCSGIHNVCKKVDEIKETLTRMEDRRELAKDVLATELLSINKAIGRIEGHMDSDRRGSDFTLMPRNAENNQ